MPSYSLADPPILAFVVLPATLAIVFVWGVAAAWRRTGQPARSRQAAMKAAAGTLIWMGVTFGVADRGMLLDWHSTPPPLAFLVVSIVTLPRRSRSAARCAAGATTDMELVAVQAFRLPLEIAMHALWSRVSCPSK